MHYIFNHSCVGYSHLKNNKPCQDYSASYKDNERYIITCCDGHGGEQYVRSQYGSKAASDAVISVFKSLDKSFFLRKDNEQLAEQIKLLILCEYNKYVERELGARPIKNSELLNLNEEEKDVLKLDPEKAYGTTLSGAMIYKNKLIVVCIGDTEALGVRKGKIVRLFDNSNDPVGNVTYSMSQEDAYKYMQVVIMNVKDVDGVILCSDGLSSPYQTYDNFHKSFINPMVKTVLTSQSFQSIFQWVNEIALSKGVGDDVSLSFLLDRSTKAHWYK
jgi:serine/threonine protein phosphatase PrpC